MQALIQFVSGGVICVETRPPEVPVKYHLEHLLQDSAEQ